MLFASNLARLKIFSPDTDIYKVMYKLKYYYIPRECTPYRRNSSRDAAHRQKNGFSLIELMVMIAIIELSASVAPPSYQNHANRTDIATVRVGIDSIGQAILHFNVSADLLPNSFTELSMNNLRAP